MAEQQVKKYEWQGKKHTVTELAELSGLTKTLIWARLRKGWSIHAIMTTKAATKSDAGKIGGTNSGWRETNGQFFKKKSLGSRGYAYIP